MYKPQRSIKREVLSMNEKFFSLEPEKQHRIVDAGFQVFSRNSYKKTPVSEIAEEAGISKALLFHYFQNKKELYLFLWDQAMKMREKAQSQMKDPYAGNLFDLLERDLSLKFRLIRRYPYIANFAFRAVYEKEPEIKSVIQGKFQEYSRKSWQDTLEKLDPEDYMPGLDLQMMCRQIYWTGAGYLWQSACMGPLDPQKMEEDFGRMLAFWRSIYENPEKRNKE